MLDIEQKYKDLYNTYGGKSIRLVFFKDTYRALYPSETLYPSDQLYPAEMDKDSIAFEITDSMVHADSLTITESLCSDENLNFGACESAQMEIVVSNPPQNIAGMEFLLIQSFGGYDLTRGLYTVESTPRENDRNTRRIIAYDRMNRFDNDVSGWYNSLKFPMTLKEFRDSLCEFASVPQAANSSLIHDSMMIDKTIESDVLNGRDVLRYICQINAVFGNINLAGELQYIELSKSGQIVDAITRYKAVESEEFTVPNIDTVKIQKEEGEIGGVSDNGNDLNVCVIEGNFLAFNKTTAEQTEIANKILERVSDLEYRPATFEGNGAPWYEMGDRILIKTSDGDVETIIMRRTSTGIQGEMCIIESTGTQELNRMFNVRSEIIQAKGRIAVLKKTAEEISSELKNFEDDTTSKFTQTAEQIKAEVTRAKEAEASLSIKADQIETSVTQKITDETNRATTAESKITQRADKIELSVTQEIKDRKDGETKLSSTITQTAAQIRLEVKNTTDGLSSTITQTDKRITQEITDRRNGDSTLSSKIDQTANSITLEIRNNYVKNGTVSVKLSGETGDVSITGNRLIVDSTNFKLNKAGDATITGTINAKGGKIGNWTIGANGLVGDRGAGRSATIYGGHIDGATLDVADGILQVEDGYANTSPVVRIGDFACSDEYGRSIFQSADERTGMSGDPSKSGGLYLWAGYENSGDYSFVVNNKDETRIRGSLHVSGNIYLNGLAVTPGGGGSSSISGSVKSLKVGYDLEGDWGGDWLEIYPKTFPDINENPEYEGMDYLYVYLERHYKE